MDTKSIINKYKRESKIYGAIKINYIYKYNTLSIKS